MDVRARREPVSLWGSPVEGAGETAGSDRGERVRTRPKSFRQYGFTVGRLMNNAVESADLDDSDLQAGIGSGATAASGSRLGPTVTAGPVNVTVFGGVPLVEVTEFVRHMSGRRLAGFFMEALTKADCVIEAQQRETSDGH
ncbi:Uncharacterised protein [Mycobacteroides abscessus subsp. abscessus]|nr:Uncharacterised protein [Mycobacteroides abscessus subsp. abscessus]